jgi:hypothetical protein
LRELESVPKKTSEYWERVKKDGGVFLMFPFITDVMVKAKVDTLLAEEIFF